MASNAQKIINRYGDGTREENRDSGKRGDYVLEYKYTKRILDRYITRVCNVIEIGCGTGYYGMYLTDRCKNYTGLDIAPGNIGILRKKIQERGLKNVEALVGDATELKNISDEKYDVVLTFGPMYHLPPKERELVFAESKRVCKAGGIIMFAYINKLGVYVSACISQPDEYPNKKKNQSILTDGIDDTRDDIYWFTMPEDMEYAAEVHQLAVIENLGVDFILSPSMYNPPATKKESWDELLDFMCSSCSCTGFANHAVMVCRKT